jgi:transposase InsO family protein
LADIAQVAFVRKTCKFCDTRKAWRGPTIHNQQGQCVPKKLISADRLDELNRQLLGLPQRSAERRRIVYEMAAFYGVSETSLYRALRSHLRPKAVRRSDYGAPRVLPREEMEHYCELIAAVKVRTCNKKGRCLSTGEAIRLLEEFGIETPEGLVKVDPGVLKRSTVNRYLLRWNYDKQSWTRQPAAVRFQAEHSNECWQFDLSPSDLKQIKEPPWLRPDRAAPTLMLFSVVDDRSGAAYQEYRCVYGEDVESALRFLFNAMSEKTGFPFQGIPQMIYTDNGPIAKSRVFQQMMRYLKIEVRTHLPAGSDGRRVTARSKGKVERPFRTVKEMHETLYHFHEPSTEEEANAWLMNFLLRYNSMQHRSEPHSRIEDWVENLPPSGLCAMCSWERFRTFAREPERRKVGGDARVTAEGVSYVVDPELAGETVVLWWGLFDNELYVEYGDQRFGPYLPDGGPIPLNRYRAFKKTAAEKQADRIEELAARLGIPRAALSGHPQIAELLPERRISATAFADPDPFQELQYPNAMTAKRAIADYLGTPLGRLPAEQMQQIQAIVDATLDKKSVLSQVRQCFRNPAGEQRDAE